LSPAIHNAAYAAAGIDWVYVAFDVPPGGAGTALAGMRAMGIRGLSVTMPHKEEAFTHVDVVDEGAAALRSVNCVTLLGDGRLQGSSTDGDGLVMSLRFDHHIAVDGMNVIVIGAGGAARSVVEAVTRAGAAAVGVVNRSPATAVAAAALGGNRGHVAHLAEVTDADLVIHATSVGMGSDDLAFDTGRIGPNHIVVDLVYHPLDTALLRQCRARGARTVDGLGMLVHQAGLQFERWTGESAPIEEMRTAALAELAARDPTPHAEISIDDATLRRR
jgi:shikimate dehydrogenase